jgi:GNAT superfamily N-acetyltransferase
MLKYERNILIDANIYETFNVDKYFCIHIICVHPDHYGNGVGTSLVRTCLIHAQKKQCRLCVGIFPAGASYTIGTITLHFVKEASKLYVSLIIHLHFYNKILKHSIYIFKIGQTINLQFKCIYFYFLAQKFNFKFLSEMPWINIKYTKPKAQHSNTNLNIIENSFVTCMSAIVPLKEEDTVSAEDMNIQIKE